MSDLQKELSAEEKIHNAYVLLCEAKPYYKIKVSEVVEAAGINRTTFYKHYAGMPDLILSMYRRYIKLMLAVPDDMTIQTAQDLQAYTDLIWRRLLQRKTDILRMLGQPGILRMILMCGRALRKRLQHLAKKAKLTDPAVYRNIRYVPYMFVVRLFIEMKGADVLKPDLAAQQQVFDFTHSIPDNLSHYMEANLGGSSDFHYALFGAYIKLTTLDDEENITVTKLLDTAGISRTQFYLYYKNMDDFRNKFYYTCFELVIELMLYVCRRPDPVPEEEVSAMRETIYASYNGKATNRLLATGKIVEYGAYIVANLYVRYKEQLERERGALTAQEDSALIYYIGVMATVSLWYYLRRIDYETYCRNVADVKKITAKALKIPM